MGFWGFGEALSCRNRRLVVWEIVRRRDWEVKNVQGPNAHAARMVKMACRGSMMQASMGKLQNERAK